jgi:hypothetical protein
LFHNLKRENGRWFKKKVGEEAESKRGRRGRGSGKGRRRSAHKKKYMY